MNRMRMLFAILCVLLLAGATVATAATTRSFRGKTSQGKPIRFKIRSGALRGLVFRINLPCSDGTPLSDSQSDFEPIKVRHRRFSDTQSGRTDTVKIRGRIKGRKVTGKITVRDRVSSTVTCGPRTVRFTARRR